LTSIFERNLKIPEPSKIKGKGVYHIGLEPEASVPIVLRKLRAKKTLTQGDIAKRLGISYSGLSTHRKTWEK